jgi:hypothetical protein
MRRLCRVIPVVLLLMATWASAAPSVVPSQDADSSSDERSLGGAFSSFDRLPSAPTNLTDSHRTIDVDQEALNQGIDDPAATTSLRMLLPPQFPIDPLSDMFQQEPILAQDSMRVVPENVAPAQPPILVPALDYVFFNSPELDILLVMALGAVLYWFGARALRLSR